jgi:CRP-like cAMP-binding protein
MKCNPGHNYEEAFSCLRNNLATWGVPPEFTDEIVARNIAVPFEKGALIFGEGSSDGLLGCVLAGYIKVYCAVGDGSRTLIRLAGPGELIGFADYVDSKGRHARLFEAQSSSKCVVALVSRDHIARLLATLDSNALVDMIQALNTFWSQHLRGFAMLLNLPFAERLEVVLSELAERAGVKDARGTILIPELAHEDLAEMIGCSRPMVSRLLAEMAENGLLMRRGKQYLLLNKWQSSAKRDLPQVKPRVEVAAAKPSIAPQVARIDAAAARNGFNHGLRSVRSSVSRLQ